MQIATDSDREASSSARIESNPRFEGVPVAVAENPDREAPPPLAHPAAPTRGLAERCHAFRDDRTAYRQFLSLIGGAVGTLGLAMLLQFALYHYHFAHQPDFLGRYGWWFVYLDITVVALVTMLVYFRTYHLSAVSHMLGMMMGMTVGMQVGTMIGAVLGATNGFFVGAVVGMSAGALAGIYIGCRCGTTMAVIQGLMSGVMAGTMGAMLIVMMLRDRLLTFMPLFTLANVMIVMGLVYLFHEEAVATGHCHRYRTGGWPAQATFSLLIIALLGLLMLYGPKGPMVWTGAPAGSNPGPAMSGMPNGAAMPGM